MGVENYAVNHQTSECYQLGKGCWFDLAEERMSDCEDCEPTLWIPLLPQSDLKTKVRGVLTDGYLRLPEALASSRAAQIASALLQLSSGGDLELVNDTSWRWPFEGYRVIGSRYDET